MPLQSSAKTAATPTHSDCLLWRAVGFLYMRISRIFARFPQCKVACNLKNSSLRYW